MMIVIEWRLTDQTAAGSSSDTEMSLQRRSGEIWGQHERHLSLVYLQWKRMLTGRVNSGASDKINLLTSVISFHVWITGNNTLKRKTWKKATLLNLSFSKTGQKNRFERQLLPPVNEKQHLQTAFAALDPLKIFIFLCVHKEYRMHSQFSIPTLTLGPQTPSGYWESTPLHQFFFHFQHICLLPPPPCLSCIFLSFLGVYMCSCLVYWLICVHLQLHPAFCPYIITGVRTLKTCLRLYIRTCYSMASTAQTTVWNFNKQH